MKVLIQSLKMEEFIVLGGLQQVKCFGHTSLAILSFTTPIFDPHKICFPFSVNYIIQDYIKQIFSIFLF